jgi:hypothetical protein
MGDTDHAENEKPFHPVYDPFKLTELPHQTIYYRAIRIRSKQLCREHIPLFPKLCPEPSVDRQQAVSDGIPTRFILEVERQCWKDLYIRNTIGSGLESGV